MQHRKAFTLLELMITIGVIALLAALLLPVASRIREQAKCVQCLGNLRQIGLGFQIYTTTNKDQFPPSDSWVYITAAQNPNFDFWVTGLIPKAMGSRVSASVFRCPSDLLAIHPVMPYSYSANGQILHPYDGSPAKPVPPLRTGAIVNPEQIILLVDESSSTLDNADWSPSHYAGGPGVLTADGRNLLSNRHDRAAETSADPNAGRGNVLFCDFHADIIPRIDSTNPSNWLAYPGQPMNP